MRVTLIIVKLVLSYCFCLRKEAQPQWRLPQKPTARLFMFQFSRIFIAEIVNVHLQASIRLFYCE